MWLSSPNLLIVTPGVHPMKIIFTSLLVLIIGKISFGQSANYPQSPTTQPIEESDINKFNRRLEMIYQQKNDDTLTQQIVYGSVEFVAAYQLNSFITKVDQRKISSLC